MWSVLRLACVCVVVHCLYFTCLSLLLHCTALCAAQAKRPLER